MNDVNDGWFIRLFVSPGMQRWADSNSSLIRAGYVFSHPVVMLCLAIYLTCLFEPTSGWLTNDYVVGMLGHIDELTNIPLAFAARSKFPVETASFFRIWVFLMPIMILLLAPRIARAEKKGWYSRWKKKSLYWQFFMIVGLVFVFVGSAMGILIPGDPSFCKGCTTDAKTGLFFIYGFGAPVGFALLLAGIPSLCFFFAKSCRVVYLSRR
jgi:hypothetical protein